VPQNPPFHSSIAAAWLILGREIVPNWPSWPDKTCEILALTGAGRSQAYEIVGRLRASIKSILGKPGRPTAAPISGNSLMAASKAIQGYLLRHPGSVYYSQSRFQYTDDFRCFVVGLVEDGQPAAGLSVAELAEACEIPLGTLKDWFSKSPGPTPPTSAGNSLKLEHQHQIVTLYQSWKGNFEAFCRMVREQYRLNYGMTFIGNLLHQTGLRKRKPHTSKQAVWSHGTFRSLFPGAQWVGDGSSIKVGFGDDTFTFNLEVLLDVASNALVGGAVSDFEDEAVLLEAYRDGVATTGHAPMACSLDNRASNHTPAVVEAMRQTNTSLLATTLGRGQSKAPVEGAFGLFNQELPAILVGGQNSREMAQRVLELVFIAWARGRNGRPRKKLGKLSPSAFYRSANPTAEEVAEAKALVQDLLRRQEQMRRTREERADPVKLEFLRHALAGLGIDDPGDRLALSLAYYSRDAIVDGLSIYQAKQKLGTLPPNALPGPYLGGIIRNAHDQAESTVIAELHLQNRERLQDLSLRTLLEQAADLQLAIQRPDRLMLACIDRALTARWVIDSNFWVLRCVEAISGIPALTERKAFYLNCARRIASSFKADRQRKQQLLARLAKATFES